MSLILASSSPYRAQLLRRLHVPFSVQSPNVDETPQAGEAPQALALRLALAKAQVVAQQHPGSLVIGADQVATVEDKPIGKPGTFERAQAQLRQLRGQGFDMEKVMEQTILHAWDSFYPLKTESTHNGNGFFVPPAAQETPWDCAI